MQGMCQGNLTDEADNSNDSFSKDLRSELKLAGVRRQGEEAHPLLHPVAYYTLNEIPKN